MIYEKQAIIERIRRVSASIQRLDIAVDKAHRGISAGQLFLVRAVESLDPYLREPWTPLHVERTSVTVERPAGILYTPGQAISMIGPIGKPIPLGERTRTLLLIAYESTPAALLLLAETAFSKGIAVTLVLIGAARYYPLDALPQDLEIIRGDLHDFAWPNQAQTISWADQIVAVAPPYADNSIYRKLIDSARTTRVEIAAGYSYGLFQPPMPCGVGACSTCLIRVKGGEMLACLDGPALDLTLIDGAGS